MRVDLAYKVPCPIHYEATGFVMCPDQGGDYGRGCIECPLLLDKLARENPVFSWLCPWCLSAVSTENRGYRARRQGVLLHPRAKDVPGFYGDGVCEGILVDKTQCRERTGLLSLIIWDGDFRLPNRIDWSQIPPDEETEGSNEMHRV